MDAKSFAEDFFKRHPNLRRFMPKKVLDKPTGDSFHGEARQHGDEIWISPKFWKLDRKVQDFVFAHELGHYALSQRGLSNMVNLAQQSGVDVWDVMSLPFGQHNMDEAFADAFASYHLTPGELKSRYPAWIGIVEQMSKTAVKRAPSFPYLTDEYEPTNEALWEKVKAVARGDAEKLTVGGRTITKPKAKYIWPSPPASAWAIKQYNGFGGGWRKTGAERAALRILLAGGLVTTQKPEEHARMQKLADKGLAKLIRESPKGMVWEPGYKLQVDNPQQVNRVLSRWKQAVQDLDPRSLKKVLEKAVHRTRDYPARMVKFDASKSRDGWKAEAWVEYKYPASKIPVQQGKVPVLPVLHMSFEFDPAKAMSLRADVKSPVLGTTKRIYENHRITGDYERTIRSVLLSYQPEVVWK